MTQPRWTEKEIEFLRVNYPNKGKNWCIESLKRPEGSVRKKAFSLGLRQDKTSDFFKDWQRRAKESKIGQENPKLSLFLKQKSIKGELWIQKNGHNKETKKFISENTKSWIQKNGHSKGMLGKTHSEKTKQQMSKKRIGVKLNLSQKERQRRSNQAQKNIHLRLKQHNSIYSRSNQGWYKIKTKKYYFRSSWEVVVARYFEWLKMQKIIKKWEYEPDVFWFNNIKRGVRSYLPDFKITNNDGSQEYYEVKGYMDSKSKTKIKRIAKYYPEITLYIIDKPYYQTIKLQERLFPPAKETAR